MEIGTMKKIAVAALVGGMALASANVVHTAVNDSWITTKATILLLTTDGFIVKSATVDTIDGKVTIHGRVATDTDRTKAEQTVLKVDGVKSVANRLQVVPANRKDMVTAVSDSDVKERVEASLKTDPKMTDVKVTSVDDGIVVLSGHTDNLDGNLRAIQSAYTVQGVYRVTNDIQTTTEN
jgi:osmotically-inducible protein OsmY